MNECENSIEKVNFNDTLTKYNISNNNHPLIIKN